MGCRERVDRQVRLGWVGIHSIMVRWRENHIPAALQANIERRAEVESIGK